MRDAVIVSAARTAVGKAPKGTLRATRPDDLAAAALRGALDRVPGLDAREISDVILGCAMPEGEQGMNLARIASLRAGLPVESAAMTVNRFCASGLESIAMAADRVRGGAADVIVAGGAESMSMVPMGGNKISVNPWLERHYPDSYLSMGLTAERVARHYGVSRQDADQFAYASHRKALAAQAAGRFAAEIVPLTVSFAAPGQDSRVQTRQTQFAADEGPRADTSLEALGSLKPAFHAKGTVTAGNASQTSDGAAAVVVMEAGKACALGLRPLARFVAYAYAGCLPEEMGMGPVHAVPKALRMAGLSLGQIDLIELNEAFAVQALAVIAQLGLDPDRVNVNGGAIALGHPIGASGAVIATKALYELQRTKTRYALVTMCIGGGQGIAAVFERL